MEVRYWFVVSSVIAAFLLTACGASSPAAPVATSPPVTASRGSSAASASTVIPAAGDGALSEVIAAARQEGTLNWAISPDSVQAVEPLKSLVKSRYGVDLEINANGQLNYGEKVAKTISEQQAGAPPTFDMLDVSESTVSPMIANHAAKEIEWARYIPGLPDDAVIKSIMLVTYDGFLMPAYNPKAISADAAPKSYDDLVDPRWRGKISVIGTLSNWAWLAQPGLWGEDRLYAYMEKLFAQQPAVERYGGMLARLVSGEYPIASGIDSGQLWTAQRKGQPVETILATPIRDGKYGPVITSNALHPHAAMLVALAEVSPEGQAIRDRVTAQTAGWVKGTPAEKFLAEHQTVPINIEFLIERQVQIVKRLDQIAKAAR